MAIKTNNIIKVDDIKNAFVSNVLNKIIDQINKTEDEGFLPLEWTTHSIISQSGTDTETVIRDNGSTNISNINNGGMIFTVSMKNNSTNYTSSSGTRIQSNTFNLPAGYKIKVTIQSTSELTHGSTLTRMYLINSSTSEEVILESNKEYEIPSEGIYYFVFTGINIIAYQGGANYGRITSNITFTTRDGTFKTLHDINNPPMDETYYCVPKELLGDINKLPKPNPGIIGTPISAKTIYNSLVDATKILTRIGTYTYTRTHKTSSYTLPDKSDNVDTIEGLRNKTGWVLFNDIYGGTTLASTTANFKSGNIIASVGSTGINTLYTNLLAAWNDTKKYNHDYINDTCHTSCHCYTPPCNCNCHSPCYK